MKKLLPLEASILGGELAFDENGDPRGAQFYIFQYERRALARHRLSRVGHSGAPGRVARLLHARPDHDRLQRSSSSRRSQAARGDAHVRLSGVSKSYGSGRARVEALAEVDLEIGVGEFVVVIGPRGSGKTTLIELVGATQRPTAGEIVVGGHRLDLLDDRGRLEFRTQNIALAPQTPTLAPTLSVYETVFQVVRLRGSSHLRDRTRELLDAVGLQDDDAPAADLSAEEQQRLSVARALAKEAPLFLADEPLSAASPDARQRLVAILRRLAREGTTILLTAPDSDTTPTTDRIVHL